MRDLIAAMGRPAPAPNGIAAVLQQLPPNKQREVTSNPDIMNSIGALLESGKAVGEVAAVLVSGAVAEPVSGITGLLTGDVNAIPGMQQRMTYKPSETGQKALGRIGSGITKAAEATGLNHLPGYWKDRVVPAMQQVGGDKAGAGAGAAMLGAMAIGAPRGSNKIKAFHGSPHDFDEFQMSQIGTGEGAQAYGHGLYFAEAEDVAKTYKQAPETLQGFDNFAMSDAANKYVNDIAIKTDDELLSYAADELTTGDFPPDVIKIKMREQGADYSPEEIDAAIAKFDELLESVNKDFSGRMYQVEIDASPDELLDWDKPLSEQPQAFQAFRKVYIDEVQRMDDPLLSELYNSPDDVTMLDLGLFSESKGGQSYNTAAASNYGRGASSLSEKLKDAGIKGIKYADGNSRGANGGTSNFVIFDERLITISKKYGIAIPAAAAMLYGEENASQGYEQI